MSRRWEGYLNKAEEEAPKIKAHADAAPSAGQQLKNKAQQAKNSVHKTSQTNQMDQVSPAKRHTSGPDGAHRI